MLYAVLGPGEKTGSGLDCICSWPGCVKMGLVYLDRSRYPVVGLLPYPVDAPVLAASLTTSH
jgi:hypothetical protein